MIIITFITLTFITLVASEACCYGNLGSPINQIDWTRYVSNVKDQMQHKTCWAHATTSFLEIKYSYQEDIQFKLSVSQIVDNTYKEIYNPTLWCSERDETDAGGLPYCALSYVKSRGIMTQRDYILNGYDIRKVTSIGISRVYSSLYIKTRNSLLKQLNSTPLLIAINADKLTDINNDIVLNTITNHAVVATNVCEFNNNLYLEFLNSYGSSWGTCGGYGYIRITDNNDLDTLIDNRGFMQYISNAELINLRMFVSDSCSDSVNRLFNMDIGIFVFLALILTFLIIVLCYVIFITMKMSK